MEQFEDGKPVRVKVGPFDYSVAWCELQRNEECVGLHQQLPLLLSFDRHLPDSLLAVTFVHEVLHALYAIEHKPEEALPHEQQADLYSAGLTAFWRDNPQTFKWWGALIA